jgi:hypothetical protein
VFKARAERALFDEGYMQFSRLTTRIAAITLSLILGSALAGCGGSPDPIYSQAFGFQCPHHDNDAVRLACANEAPGDGTETVSRYCYRTLGDTNCFDRPDQDRKNQELGSSGY